MPGLLGLVAAADAGASATGGFVAARDRMLRVLGTVADEIRPDRRCLLAHVRRNRPSACVDGPVTAIVHGVIYGPTGAMREETAAAFVARNYRLRGMDGVSGLAGEYCFAVFDSAKTQLLLVTDAIGSHPLYWHAHGTTFVFGSDLSAVLKAAPGVRRVDLKAVADYVTLGAIFGRKTLVSGVELVEPGTVLTYDLDRGTVSEHQYLDLASFFTDKSSSRSAYLESLTSSFGQAVARACDDPRRVGLSLSGGLDSRTILSAIDHPGSLLTYTLGVDGCADQVIGAQLSAIAGTEHTFFPLDRRYLNDFIANMAAMVSLSDGMYLSHGLTEMLALRYLGETGIEVLLRGHGGELAKAHLAWPLHTDAAVYGLRTHEQLACYISRRANYLSGGIELRSLFAAGAAEAASEGARTSILKALSHTDLTPAQGCSYLYLRELNRRFTIPSLELFRTCVDVRLPFLDADFLRVLLAAPPEWRDSTAIHQALTQAGLPALLKVRNSNTGAAANAGARTEFVLDKVNTLLKRLNVYGYRHYHDFDEWMRTMLLANVESHLLSSDTRVLTFLERSTLEDFISQTRQRTADFGYLLQTLLIVELWMRENDIAEAA